MSVAPLQRAAGLCPFLPRAIPIVAIVMCAGCVEPDLGNVPFLCHNGNPECPDGYTCKEVSGQKVCVKDGSDPPKLTDASVPGDAADGQVPPDGQIPPDGPKPPPADGPGPQPGVVLVTEFMANPKAASDTDGEWIELFNPGSAAVDINGWTLQDKGTDKHVITAASPLRVPATGYLVLGRNTDKAKNGGVDVGYVYKDFFLSNTEDEVELVNAAGKVIDSFAYSKAAGFTIPEAASLSVMHPNADKNKAASWCTETKAWSGSAGDKGTPGANPGC
jgi:hypothetical protein